MSTELEKEHFEDGDLVEHVVPSAERVPERGLLWVQEEPPQPPPNPAAKFDPLRQTVAQSPKLATTARTRSQVCACCSAQNYHDRLYVFKDSISQLQARVKAVDV